MITPSESFFLNTRFIRRQTPRGPRQPRVFCCRLIWIFLSPLPPAERVTMATSFSLSLSTLFIADIWSPILASRGPGGHKIIQLRKACYIQLSLTSTAKVRNSFPQRRKIRLSFLVITNAHHMFIVSSRSAPVVFL